MGQTGLLAQDRRRAVAGIAENNHQIDFEPYGEVSSAFGINTFNDQVMREKLPKDVYTKLDRHHQDGRQTGHGRSPIRWRTP
ncbi:MAG: hypothetical protein MZU84_02175 [Sphingobacterium sp.]|nr:hypothetical protein [Sphingobacterium sp.]